MVQGSHPGWGLRPSHAGPPEWCYWNGSQWGTAPPGRYVYLGRFWDHRYWDGSRWIAQDEVRANPGLPAAGWYSDPSGQAGLRWWSGTEWSVYTSNVPVLWPTPAHPPGPLGAMFTTVPRHLRDPRPAWIAVAAFVVALAGAVLCVYEMLTLHPSGPDSTYDFDNVGLILLGGIVAFVAWITALAAGLMTDYRRRRYGDLAPATVVIVPAVAVLVLFGIVAAVPW